MHNRVHVQCTYGARAGHVLPTHVHCAALTRRFHPLRRVVGTPTWHSAEALEGLLRNAVAAGVAPRFCSQVRARISELGRERGDMVPRRVGRGRPAEACHSSLAWPTSWGGLSRPLAALRIGPRIGPRCRAAQGPLGGCGAAVSPGQSSLQPRPKPPISRRSTPRWGVALKQPKGLVQCAPPKECLWADFGGAAHHLSFSADRESFESNRVGDGEIVLGARVH